MNMTPEQISAVIAALINRNTAIRAELDAAKQAIKEMVETLARMNNDILTRDNTIDELRADIVHKTRVREVLTTLTDLQAKHIMIYEAVVPDNVRMHVDSLIDATQGE